MDKEYDEEGMKDAAFIYNISFVIAIGAMISHILRCIEIDDMTMLTFGIVMSPFGVVHGIGILFGIW